MDKEDNKKIQLSLSVPNHIRKKAKIIAAEHDTTLSKIFSDHIMDLWSKKK